MSLILSHPLLALLSLFRAGKRRLKLVACELSKACASLFRPPEPSLCFGILPSPKHMAYLGVKTSCLGSNSISPYLPQLC